MKTYSFDIFNCTVTITIKKKTYRNAHMCREAYNLSYTDVYDFCAKKQSLKKWEIELMEEPERLCLMEAAEKYIDSKRGELAASTIKGYKNIIEHHFNDLWLIWLDKLTEEHLQQAFDNEIEKGFSKKTLSGYRSFVLKVLAVYRPDFKPVIRIEKDTADEIA